MTASLFPSFPLPLFPFSASVFRADVPNVADNRYRMSRSSEVIQFGQLFGATSASHSSIRNVENGHRSTRLK